MGRNTQNYTKCYLSKYVLFLSTFWWVKKTGNEFEVKGEPTWFWREIFTPETFAKSGNFGTFCYSGYFWLYFGYIWENVRYSTNSQLLSTWRWWKMIKILRNFAVKCIYRIKEMYFSNPLFFHFNQFYLPQPAQRRIETMHNGFEW